MLWCVELPYMCAARAACVSPGMRRQGARVGLGGISDHVCARPEGQSTGTLCAARGGGAAAALTEIGMSTLPWASLEPPEPTTRRGVLCGRGGRGRGVVGMGTEATEWAAGADHHPPHPRQPASPPLLEPPSHLFLIQQQRAHLQVLHRLGAVLRRRLRTALKELAVIQVAVQDVRLQGGRADGEG